MTQITFKVLEGTTTTVAIPAWAPDISFASTSGSLLLIYPTSGTTTWSVVTAKEGAGLCLTHAYQALLAYDSRHIVASWHLIKGSAHVSLNYIAVGELVRT